MLDWLRQWLRPAPRGRTFDRRHFDEARIPEDVWRVSVCASLLGVSEFRVFEIAFERWHGQKATEEAIERHFVAYMFNDIVPHWVRHLCQIILTEAENDRLDPARYGIIRRPATAEQKRTGVEFLGWVIFLVLGLIVLAEATGRALRLGCLFPPCY